MIILVTGGKGLVGYAMSQSSAGIADGNTWIYVGSSDANLTVQSECDSLFERYRPDYIVHLAGLCGSYSKHQTKKVELFRENVLMNENVLHSCLKYGVKKGIFCSSYAAYDENLSFIESTELNDILYGKPRSANLSYGFAKKMEVLQVDNYNTEYGCNFTCLLPVNLFGENDKFSEDGHFVSATISRFEKGKDIFVYGSANTERYFLYSKDLANYIIALIRMNLQKPYRLLCSPPKSYSIENVVSLINKIYGSGHQIKYQNYDAVHNQVVSNKTMIELVPDFVFTDMEEALKSTIGSVAKKFDASI